MEAVLLVRGAVFGEGTIRVLNEGVTVCHVQRVVVQVLVVPVVN